MIGRISGEKASHPDCGRKMDLPNFACEDVCGWLLRIKRYFRITGVDEYEKMELVLVVLEREGAQLVSTVGRPRPYATSNPTQFRSILVAKSNSRKNNGGCNPEIDSFEEKKIGGGKRLP